MEERPVAGDFYRHFKGKLYQVITVAKDADRLEEMVVYQALYGTFQTYVRSLQEFVEELDKNQYPDATQKYRFEKVTLVAKEESSQVQTSCTAEPLIEVVESEKEAQEKKQVEQIFFEFLDSESSQERLELLAKIKNDLDVRMVNNIAAAMDLPCDEEDVEKQYEFIVQNLKQRAKFECDRFRR